MDVLVIGASGSSAEIALPLQDKTKNIDGHSMHGFLDDDPNLMESLVLGWPVLGPVQNWVGLREFGLASGIGNSVNFVNRYGILDGIRSHGGHFVRVIASDANTSFAADISGSAVVASNSFIGSHAVLEDFVYVMPNSVVSHHSRIGRGTIVCSGVVISGDCDVGPFSYIGAGATVKDHISIGPRILVGSGSNVICDLHEEGIYVGNPAELVTRDA